MNLPFLKLTLFVTRFLLCSSVDPPKAGQACLELLGGITITTMNHTRYKSAINIIFKLLIIQAVDYSYSDYDYQPEEGRSLGAEDEYYEDIAPARAYNFQFQVCKTHKI